MPGSPCPVCGFPIEPESGGVGTEIVCPRCRHAVAIDSDRPDQHAETRRVGPSPEHRPGETAPPALSTGRPTEETLVTRGPGHGARHGDDRFEFLAPAGGPDEIGRLGHYRVVRLLGSGGMGLVFHAEDSHLERPVALKVVRPDMARDSGLRERFLREARATACVRSDHVVTIHQVGQENDTPFLAMELLEGQSLQEWLERGQRPDSPKSSGSGARLPWDWRLRTNAA